MSSDNLTESFTVEEMKCHHCGVCNMNPDFMALLQKFRDTLARSINITSGFRCAVYNAQVDGVPGSQHLIGRAADIAVSPIDRYLFVKTAFDLGFKGIGVGKNFIHIDIREGDCNLWKYG